MRLFDYRCPVCGYVRVDVPTPLHQQMDVRCPDCPLDAPRCERMPAAPGFAIHGFNAKNGYSKEHQ